MPDTVRQHTVPRFYLRHFAIATNRNRIQMACRETGRVIGSTVSDASVVKRIYTLPASSSLPRMLLEEAFSELEADCAPILSNIIESRRIQQQERSSVAPFLAAQLKRTTLIHEAHTKLQRNAKSPEKIIAYVENNRRRYERVLGKADVDKFIAEVQAGRTEIDIQPAEMMLESQRNLKEYVEVMLQMNWMLVRAKKVKFITSDNPVFVRRRGHPLDSGLVGIERKDLEAELYCPLSPELLLLANWDGRNPHKNPVNPPRVRELNRLVVLCSNRFVFGEITPEIQKLVEEHRGFKLELPNWDPADITSF